MNFNYYSILHIPSNTYVYIRSDITNKFKLLLFLDKPSAEKLISKICSDYNSYLYGSPIHDYFLGSSSLLTWIMNKPAISDEFDIISLDIDFIDTNTLHLVR